MLRLVHSAADPAQQQSLDEEALNWVVRLTSGECDGDDHEAFRAWRDQSVAHAEALARARTLWTQVGTALPSAGKRRGMGRVARAVSLAASLLLCVEAGQHYLHVGRFDQVTASGERRTVRLPDGSRMTLAGDTAVNIRFRGGVRRIELARGQAMFQVRHDDRVPFVVQTGETALRDVGTIFDVRRRDDRTRVTVVEGVVEASKDDRRVLLHQGQASTATSNRQGVVENVSAWKETAWTQGRLIVEDQPLRDIIAALKPHYRGQLVILNDAAAQRRLSVVIDLSRTDDWLAGLKATRAVSVTRFGSLVVVS